jgi:hypothetical protein
MPITVKKRRLTGHSYFLDMIETNFFMFTFFMPMLVCYGPLESLYKSYFLNPLLSEDLLKRWESLISQGAALNSVSLEQFNKEAKESWNQFSQMLQVANKDASERTIVTNTKAGTSYKTDIRIDGDITNEFPEKVSEATDLYWKRHNELVDRVLNERKELLLKVIDMVGTTLTKMVNPISFSTIDLVKLAEMFRK